MGARKVTSAGDPAEAGHGPEPRGGGRTLGRWLGLGVLALLAVGLLIVLALTVTAPSPEPAPAWEELAELPESRGEVASTVVEREGGEQLLVAGGLEGLTARTSPAVHVLDPVADAWQALPDLPEPRHHAAAAALDGDIYVSGGAPSVTDWTPQDSLWVLRSGASTWEALTPMPEGRDSHRMRALDGRLHVVGGHGDTADVLVYDPDGDQWTRAAALPVPRHHLGVVVLDGELWAIGGRDEDDTVLDAVHVWDPQADRWRDGPSLPMPVSAGVEGVLEDWIHLVGGEDPAVPGGEIIEGHLTLALTLEPQEGAWRHAPPAPLAVHGAAGGVIGGRLVVSGGAARQGALSPSAWTGFTAAYDPDAG